MLETFTTRNPWFCTDKPVSWGRQFYFAFGMELLCLFVPELFYGLVALLKLDD